mgnify:CR=1 FL=1
MATSCEVSEPVSERNVRKTAVRLSQSFVVKHAKEVRLRQEISKILAVNWPDPAQYPVTKAGNAEYAEEQRRYYELTKKDADPQNLAELGKWPWKVLWGRRDRAEDAQSRAKGEATKILEQAVACTKKKKAMWAMKKEGEEPPALYSLMFDDTGSEQ